jgi:hypothetical protein
VCATTLNYLIKIIKIKEEKKKKKTNQPLPRIQSNHTRDERHHNLHLQCRKAQGSRESVNWNEIWVGQISLLVTGDTSSVLFFLLQ